MWREPWYSKEGMGEIYRSTAIKKMRINVERKSETHGDSQITEIINLIVGGHFFIFILAT